MDKCVLKAEQKGSEERSGLFKRQHIYLFVQIITSTTQPSTEKTMKSVLAFSLTLIIRKNKPFKSTRSCNAIIHIDTLRFVVKDFKVVTVLKPEMALGTDRTPSEILNVPLLWGQGQCVCKCPLDYFKMTRNWDVFLNTGGR